MRLIDADALYEKYCTLFEGKVDEGEMDRMAYVIASMPTAYSVEKVVERLEAMKMRYFLTIANTGDEKLDAVYEEVGNAIDKAVEIIKEEGQI